MAVVANLTPLQEEQVTLFCNQEVPISFCYGRKKQVFDSGMDKKHVIGIWF